VAGTAERHQVVRVEAQVWCIADLADVMHLVAQRQLAAGAAVLTQRTLEQNPLAELAPPTVIATSGC
jgi:hypothetical protein